MHRRGYFAGAGVLCLFAIASCAGAASIAYDMAGDSAYNNLTEPVPLGLNGGYGWGGGWTIPSGAQSADGFDLGRSTSAAINSPESTLGRAFAVNGTSAIPSNNFAARPFNGALSVGQTIMVDFDPNGAGTSSDVILTGPSPSTFNYNYLIFPNSSRNYSIQVFASPAIDTGIPVAPEGVHIEFTSLDSATARLSLTSFAASQPAASFLVSNLPVAQMEVYNDRRGDRVYFNNLAITPEPAGLCMFAGASATLLLKRRKLKSR